MSDCYCDVGFDNPCQVVFESKVRRCRKPRRCCECGTMIAAGDRYHYFSGKWEDSGFDSFSTCLKCNDLRNRCEFACAPFTQLAEDVSQYTGDDIEVEAFRSRLHRYQMETNKKYRLRFNAVLTSTEGEGL